MARPLKKGLTYFPLDCRLDDNVEALEAQFGNDGFAVIVKFWQAAFETPNGRIDLNIPGAEARLARRSNVEINRYRDVLQSAALLGLIDKDSYENLGVLTSRGVRKRHQLVQKERLRWRKNKGVISGDNGVENSGNGDEKTPGNSRSNPIKKRKEKKRKEKETGGEARAKKLFKARPENLEAVVGYMRELGVQQPEVEAQKWQDHYESVDWKVGRGGNKMADWKATVRQWKSRIPEMRPTAAWQSGAGARPATGFLPGTAVTGEEIARERAREAARREQEERDRYDREHPPVPPPEDFMKQIEKLADAMRMPRVPREEITEE